MQIQFRYRLNRPIIEAALDSRLQGNVNGPSLIRVPDWVERPWAKYYLYFAHHKGAFIRLAFADDLDGEWRLYEPGALQLTDSGFATKPPRAEDLTPHVKDWIASGGDGDYPHIASPDVIIDHASQTIRMYFHGRLPNGEQVTKSAVSGDGIQFDTRPSVLGPPYLRVFRWRDCYYAFAFPGMLYRSPDVLTNFEPGPQLVNDSIRHGAPLVKADRLYMLWTRVGDRPERILASELNTRKEWRDWKIIDTQEIHRPTTSWEGAQYPLGRSEYGAAGKPENQLRDPAVFEEDGQFYLLYSIAGEQGIALGDLIFNR